MKIVFLITMLECLALSFIVLWLSRRKPVMLEALIQQPFPLKTTHDLASQVDNSHWNFVNGRLETSQGDDRRPMLGAAASGSGIQTVRRSIARRTHQASYKAWSKTRHD